MINHYKILQVCLVLCSVILFSCNTNTQTNNTNSNDNVQQQVMGSTLDEDSNSIANKNAVTRDFTYSFKDDVKKFSFPNRQSKEINLPSGTIINVPKDCFVDKNGLVAKGDVDLFFEEFLTAGSIISSQINMKYDSAGTLSDFESAGMFRINASQKGEALFIAKGKSIDVSLATTDNDRGFNAYYSKADGSDWTYLNGSSATANKTAMSQTITQQVVDIVKPVPPVSYSANGKYFDLNLSHLYTRDLNSLLGVVWEYAGNDKKKDPAVNKTNFNRQWDYVNITPSQGTKRGVYDIVLQNKDTTIKTSARPVYRGAVLDAENEAFVAELGEFNQRMIQLKNQHKQDLTEASFLRVIAVKNLGLYNYDRQYHQDDMTPVLANFNFGVDSLKDYPISVYLVTGNGMAVIKYPPHDWDKFMYARKDINKLIAILPSQEICTFSAQRFKKEAPSFPGKTPGKFTFQLKHTGLKATNAQDIDRVLSTI